MDPGGAERTDVEVLTAVAGQDRGALRTLYERHEPWITARVACRCADRHIVEEVVQDTFVGLAVGRRLRRARRGGGLDVRIAITSSCTGCVPASRSSVSAWFVPMPGPRRRSRFSSVFSTEMAWPRRALAGSGAVVQATVLDGLTTREAAALLGIPQARSRHG
jgi:RNA polymerase sigma-70 factor (ECF subfamily)